MHRPAERHWIELSVKRRVSPSRCWVANETFPFTVDQFDTATLYPTETKYEIRIVIARYDAGSSSSLVLLTARTDKTPFFTEYHARMDEGDQTIL